MIAILCFHELILGTNKRKLLFHSKFDFKPARRFSDVLLAIGDIGDCPVILLVQVIATSVKVALAA